LPPDLTKIAGRLTTFSPKSKTEIPFKSPSNRQKIWSKSSRNEIGLAKDLEKHFLQLGPRTVAEELKIEIEVGKEQCVC
jgi:hypothetical protein